MIMIVDLFIPCFIDHLYPDTAFNVVKLLEKAGVEVRYNTNQTCCGQPSFNSGYWDITRDLAEKFMDDFAGTHYIVGPSASCVGFIKNYYAEVLKGEKVAQFEKFLKPRLFELSDFLVNHLKVVDFGATFPHKATYHDACSALREYGIKEEPRKLLAHVKGLELIEMHDNEVCCGFGGTFSVKHKHISTAMVEQKVEYALDTGAEYIISTESSCLLNIESYTKKQKQPIKSIHLADVLTSGW